MQRCVMAALAGGAPQVPSSPLLVSVSCFICLFILRSSRLLASGCPMHNYSFDEVCPHLVYADCSVGW